MKKFVAIVIALVMVLSMTSAFALSECATWGTNWDCIADSTWCGKGAVEIVPLVKVNTSCGWEYQVSDCATAIRSTDVWFAVKLTVEAYPDPDWWNEAVVDFETAGLDLNWEYAPTDLNDRAGINGIDLTATEEKVYYLTTDWAWADSSVKGFKIDDAHKVVWTAEVVNADVCTTEGYSVCADLQSYYDGFSKKAYNKVGDYEYRLNTLSDETMVAYKALSTDGMDELLSIWDRNADGTVKNMVQFTIVDGYIAKEDRSGATAEFYNKVMADFGFDACGTAACLYEKNFFNNFGWNDSQEDCFDWSDKGAATVNPECSVEIPKTGDVSVVAYAVMAIVAAAGTMLKK